MIRRLDRVLVLSLGSAIAASMAGAGTDFAHMPVGCSWTTEYSNGNVWRTTFKGRKDGYYLTRTVEAARKSVVVNTMLFDAAGNLVARDWGQGKWERFEPYSCFDVIGSCTYTYSNADGVRNVILNKTRKSADGYTVKARIKGGAAFPDERIEIGPFGLVVKSRASNYSAEIVSFQGCGDEAS